MTKDEIIRKAGGYPNAAQYGFEGGETDAPAPTDDPLGLFQ